MTTRIRSAYAAAFALAAALVLVASAVSPGSAFAAVSAVYTASTNPTYENPATGAIEDAAGGSNVALAESMVTSIVYENALIERDTDGVMHASLRFKLADQISSISLEASEDGASYEPVEVVQMQTGTDSATSTATADYRIAIPSETATLRCSMDVIPMGRAVVYFITFGALQEGDADGTFVVSVTPGEGTDDAAPAAAAAAAAASGDAGASGGTEDAEGEQAQSADDLTGASANEGVQEFDEEGREVTGGKQAEASLDGGTIATIVGVAVAVIAVAGVAVYAAYLRPKRARQASAAAVAAAAAAPDERASRA
ncbi:heme-binding Shp domain-containing protein, partial [Eggerthella sinensis]|uniref:heme-binding Shp domain-containing protein n=1 Tax=Eggerthella sinensis TaxID=242230 RepID=UPI00266DA82B